MASQIYKHNSSDNLPPLIVDMNECLVRTNLNHESYIYAFFKNPLTFLFLPYWYFRYGVNYVKQKIGSLFSIDIDYLPYNQDLLAYLKNQSANEIIIQFDFSRNSSLQPQNHRYIDSILNRFRLHSLKSLLSIQCKGKGGILAHLNHGVFPYKFIRVYGFPSIRPWQPGQNSTLYITDSKFFWKICVRLIGEKNKQQ